MRRPRNTDDLAALTGLDRPHLNHAVAALAVHEVSGVGGRARCRYGHLTPRLAALLRTTVDDDRRWSWTVDGTLVPTRDHSTAVKSKNYRWSCNAQVLSRRTDLLVTAVNGGGPGNRNDPVHYRGSPIEELCRTHGRVLADGGYRGVPELVTPVFDGQRIPRDHVWRRHRRRRARAEHAIALTLRDIS